MKEIGFAHVNLRVYWHVMKTLTLLLIFITARSPSGSIAISSLMRTQSTNLLATWRIAWFEDGIDCRVVFSFRINENGHEICGFYEDIDMYEGD